MIGESRTIAPSELVELKVESETQGEPMTNYAANRDNSPGTTGAKLSALMQERGMSQNAVAEKAGISVATLRRIRSGDMIGMFDTWARVLTVLDADANDFVRIESQ